jgi:hypothetical protein
LGTKIDPFFISVILLRKLINKKNEKNSDEATVLANSLLEQVFQIQPLNHTCADPDGEPFLFFNGFQEDKYISAFFPNFSAYDLPWVHFHQSSKMTRYLEVTIF